MRKLPVFRSVGEVFSGVTRHYFQLLIAAWPCLLLVAVLSIGGVMFLVDVGYFELIAAASRGEQPGQMPEGMREILTVRNGVLFFLLVLGNLLLLALAAVRWHRFVLFGEGAGSDHYRILRGEDGTYIWTVLKLVVVSFGLLFLFAVPLGVFTVVGDVLVLQIVAVLLMVGVWLWTATIYLRVSLALPDAAIGGGGSIGKVFDATSGNGWRLLGYAVLIMLAMLVLNLVVSLVLQAGFVALGGGSPEQVFSSENLIPLIVLGIVNFAFYLYFTMIQITMLSVAYREIVGLPGGEGSEPAAVPSAV